MLKQHQFYVYYDGANVMARWADRQPVVAKTFPKRLVKDSKGIESDVSAQDAHDFVQTVVNPTGIKHDHPTLEGKGFHAPAFQDQISANCEAFVKAAYAKK